MTSSCHIFDKYETHLKGGKDEVNWISNSSNYSFNPYHQGFTHEPKYIDSLGNPYTGIVVKMLCKRKDTAIIENAHEIDSMCIYKGTRYGYSKAYSSSKEKNAFNITYTNILSHNELSKQFPYCKYQISVNYNTILNPKEVTKVDFTVLKENMKFTCEINYLKKNIKVKTKIERISDELGPNHSTKMKHKAEFQEKSEIKVYFKLFPEIIPQEILDRCKRLGMFNENKVEDPIIKGNCSFN
jgi:hypothetical protein